MTELAKEAFASRNYRLAVEMYERCLKQQSPTNFELLYGYGDSLAKCGRLREAIDVYSRCSTLGNVPFDKLRHLVTSLLEEIGLPQQNSQSVRSANCARNNFSFPCPHCEGALYQPVTLDCGHTFCKLCLDTCCRLCGYKRDESSPIMLFKNSNSNNNEINVLV